MPIVLTATEAVRNFSEILNNVKYLGAHYTIVRGGQPAAELGPVDAGRRLRTLAELRDTLRTLPRLDRGDATFAEDLRAIVAAQPVVTEPLSWE